MLSNFLVQRLLLSAQGLLKPGTLETLNILAEMENQRVALIKANSQQTQARWQQAFHSMSDQQLNAYSRK